MTDEIRNHTRESQQRLALARAGRVPVDSQGQPTGPPSTFTYDDKGRLIKVDAAAPEKP